MFPETILGKNAVEFLKKEFPNIEIFKYPGTNAISEGVRHRFFYTPNFEEYVH